jgi:hypothetical protein
MAKAIEIAYIEEVARVSKVPLADFKTYLLNKPFSDSRCHEYLMDIAQIMSFLPPSPARVWMSESEAAGQASSLPRLATK